MAYDALKTEIRQYINTNGQEEITGQILQNVLLDMVNAYPSLDGYATQLWVSNQGFATETWVGQNFVQNSALSNYLPLTGGTLTGDLNFVDHNNNTVANLSIVETASVPAGTLKLNGRIIANGGVMGGNLSFDEGYGIWFTLSQSARRLWRMILGDDGTYYMQISEASQAVPSFYIDTMMNVKATSFIVNNGTSSQFLKADGSVDSNTYLTSSAISDMATQTWVGQQGFLTSVPSGYATETWVGNNYLPLTGGTLTGGLTMNGTNKSIRFSTDNYVYLKRESSRLLIVNESGDDIIIGDWDDRNYITCFSDLQGGEGTSSYTSVLAQKWHILRDGSAMFSSVSQSSDIRYKINICDVNLSIENIANAPLFKFTWKDGKDGDVHIGTSAQYWQGLMPELVSENRNGVLGMQYDVAALAGVITVAKRVVDHEQRITELEKENALLKARLNIN